MISTPQAIHGFVIAVQRIPVPITQGKGSVVAGWGSTRVNTAVEFYNEFWIRDTQGFEHQFSLGFEQAPKLLPDHPVSVVICDGKLCGIRNHATAEVVIYRRPGVYESHGHRGTVSLFQLFLITLGVCLCVAAFGLTSPGNWLVFLCGFLFGFVGVLGLFETGQNTDSVNVSNQRLDHDIYRLLSGPSDGNYLS